MTISTAEMIEVDRAMIEGFHIELTHMMERGISLAPPRERFLEKNPTRIQSRRSGWNCAKSQIIAKNP